MSFKDWIGYVIKRLVWYMETPKTVRKESKRAKKERWVFRWFGMVPFSMKMYVQKKRKHFFRSKKD